MMLLNVNSDSFYQLLAMLIVYGGFGIVLYGNFAAAVYFLIKAIQHWNNDRRK